MRMLHSVLVALAVAGAVAMAEERQLGKCQKGDMDANCKFTDQKDWAYLVFVESWPGTFCNDGCCSLPADVKTNPPGFTMHGMWPNYEGKDYPSCCTSPYKREDMLESINSDKELKAALDQNWPSLKRCKFVVYETEKHGTCASTVYNGTKGYLDYWQAAMNTLRRFDLGTALRKHGIIPSKTAYYTEDEIKEAVEEEVGAKVNLHCATGNNKQLSEVRICLKRPETREEMFNPVPFDCPRLEKSCNAKHVELPPLGSLKTNGCAD